MIIQGSEINLSQTRKCWLAQSEVRKEASKNENCHVTLAATDDDGARTPLFLQDSLFLEVIILFFVHNSAHFQSSAEET